MPEEKHVVNSRTGILKRFVWRDLAWMVEAWVWCIIPACNVVGSHIDLIGVLAGSRKEGRLTSGRLGN